MQRTLQLGIAVAGLIGLSTMAEAQMTGPNDYVEAKLVAKDMESRSITVRLEGSNAMRTFKVSENAELIKNLDNIRRPIRLEDLNVGNELQLELGDTPTD